MPNGGAPVVWAVLLRQFKKEAGKGYAVTANSTCLVKSAVALLMLSMDNLPSHIQGESTFYPNQAIQHDFWTVLELEQL